MLATSFGRFVSLFSGIGLLTCPSILSDEMAILFVCISLALLPLGLSVFFRKPVALAR